MGTVIDTQSMEHIEQIKATLLALANEAISTNSDLYLIYDSEYMQFDPERLKEAVLNSETGDKYIHYEGDSDAFGRPCYVTLDVTKFGGSTLDGHECVPSRESARKPVMACPPEPELTL